MVAPGRVERFVALSVGAKAAYTAGGPLQLLKGYYVLVFQLRGIAGAVNQHLLACFARCKLPKLLHVKQFPQCDCIANYLGLQWSHV
ncbi:hypothetical protein PO883_19515 [Massilia sp. DJPM01]|uniref:hypothetical protein n=1 Tax=Massilia sp. DJPM01 TaxID=3024404 RepID=UPI00259DDE5D|nr:hypothetical protein [Massilia sp. DJPM01]MDM5179384.1 hypothetical protein [Massilia sp. DJPM01]